MPAVIGFDATAAARQSAGIGRYARHLLGALSRRDDDFRFSAYFCAGGAMHGSIPGPSERLTVRRLPVSDRIMNALWHRARIPLPVELFTGRFDLFHSPDFTLPPVLGKPTILTIHDLAFLVQPDCAYPTLRAYLEAAVPRSARRATHIIAVSESTRRAVIELLGVEENRVTTVYEAAPENLERLPEAEARRALQFLGIQPPFLLSVGTLEPRKNYVRLLEAYARLRERGISQPLVIAGARGWLYETIFQSVAELRLDEHVRFVQPSDRQLAALYSLADVFIYPSLYEGFGIPPLEALTCGTPVVCSNSSSLPEVVGDAAVCFDPRRVGDIEEAVFRVLDDAALRRHLVDRGRDRAACFSWDRAAAETVGLYEQVLRG